MIVTHAPASARKQAYTFADKLEAMRQELLAMRAKVIDKAPRWWNEESVRERYVGFCAQIHMPPQLYELKFEQSPDGLSLNFRKDAYLVSRKQAMFGKNIIITDNTDWRTGDIIEESLGRWQVEDRFRLSKDDDLVGTSPLRHWTDSKIRRHLFTCVIAMTCLRRIELKMAAAGRKRSTEEVVDDMRHLHYALTVKKGAGHLSAAWKLPVRPRAKSYRPLATTLTRVGSYRVQRANPYFARARDPPRGLSQKLLPYSIKPSRWH